MSGWNAVAIAAVAAMLWTGPALAQDDAAEDEANTRLVAPEECLSEPRTYEEIATLLALDGEGVPAPDITPIQPPLGELADAATTEAITGAIRQIVACFNAGDIPRATALMTDAGVHHVYWGLSRDEENRELARTRLPAAPERRADEFLIRLTAVTNVTQLPDGRVAAFVVINEPLLPPNGPEVHLFLFANQDGNWRLDDMIDFTVAPVAPAEEATPTA
jgi:hypothetical protein